MARAARSRIESVVVGVLSASAIALFALAGTAPSSGCATQETEPAPDAAPPPCEHGPFIFCEAVAPNAPGCSTDDGTSPLLLQLPRGTRYGVGCVVNFVGERDPQGDCPTNAICKCVVEDIGSVGSRGGDGGADAAPAPAPVPAAPAWNCPQ